MKIGEFEFPDDLYYDREHNWARVEGETVTQGMSSYGQHLASEIVYAEMPRVGREVKQGEYFMSMESGKWVGRIRAAVSGKITEANEELEWEASLINESPYDEGWLAKIEASDLSELDNLLRASDPEFASFLEEEMARYGGAG